MRKFIKKHFDSIKKYGVIATIGLMGLGLTSCGKSETTETTTIAATTEATTSTTTEAVTTEVQTEAVTEATTERVDTDGLDIYDNASIENAVDKSYDTYKEFYDNLGISKDQIRDMIFVSNDVYTDEDGKLVIDEERALDAYMNIKKVLLSPKMNMDVYNTMLSPEEVYKLESAPSLADFIDIDLAGGNIVADEIKEYEALRNSQIKLINEKGQVDVETVKNYVIKNEITDIDNYSNAPDSVSKNGHKFILTAIHYSGLQLASAVTQDQYIKSDKRNIKINPSDDEVILESRIIELDERGYLPDGMLDDVVKYVKVEEDINDDLTDEELAKKVSEKYRMELDESNLLIAYARYVNSMDIYMYIDDMCDEQNETVKDIEVKRKNTSSLNNTKRLILA